MEPLHLKDQLLHQVRKNFGIFGGISLIFGIIATLLFYKAGIGLNSFLFTIIMVTILTFVSKKLGVLITKGTALIFLAAILLGLSNVLTSSWRLQLLNSVGILLLLAVSLIRLFSVEKHLSFIENLHQLIKLPFKALSSLGLFIVDGNQFIKDKKLIKNDKLRNIIIGCIIAIPFMVITIALLSSADLLFGKITKSMFEWIFYRDIYIIIVTIILGTLLCYSLLCGATKESAVTGYSRAKSNSTIGITVSTLLLLIYILFCGIQSLYLFAGGIFELPVEFTFAEYARRGFFELLAVTCFNIVLILICVNVFEENKWLKAILTAITACTYIMIASATYRMLLYIGAYHLTFLRMFVLLFLLIDAFLLAGVIISLYHKSFPLFGYSVFIVSLCYMIFSFSKPDYHIARYFVTHTEEIKIEDFQFLTVELSYDAAPVVSPLLERRYDYNIQSIIGRYYNNTLDKEGSWDIREYNYSDHRAIDLMKQHSSFKN